MQESDGAARRGRGFGQAGARLGREIREAAARRGFAEPEVLLRWREIVGPELEALCRPVKVAYGRTPALGATLHVEVAGARAPEVELSAPAILERVNQHYGYRAVGRLRIVQAGAGAEGFAEAGAAFRGPGGRDGAERATTAAARAEADRLAAGIESPRLRATLSRLGALVLSRAAREPR